MSSPERMVQMGEAALEVEEGSLLDQIVEKTKMMPSDDGYEIAKRGVGAFVAELLRPENKEERVNKNLVDRMIAELDLQLGKQVDEIVHDENFQKLESAWRGLKMFVDRTDFGQNIKIQMINASKEDLYDDFEDAPDVTKSGLYKLAYTAEYGQFGGEPVGAIVANYDLVQILLI